MTDLSVDQLPVGSAVTTLAHVYVKVSEGQWTAPMPNGGYRYTDNDLLSTIGVEIVFDSTEQIKHLGKYFVEKFDSI